MKKQFDEEDGLDYDLYLEKLNNQTNSIKNQYVNEFSSNAEKYLADIEQKKKKAYQEKLKYVYYILDNSDKFYDKTELLSYDLPDVLEIYDKIKENKKPAIIRFFKFIFNV